MTASPLSNATERYVTVEHPGSSEVEDRKSVFIGKVIRISDEAEAQAFIKQQVKEYPDARHHVWAYRLGENTAARFSDDGEPQGSAGLPVMEAVKSSGATDVCVVVTRYFGGTLLGVGGLVRAYGKSAALALADAHIITYVPYDECVLSVSYPDYGRLLPEWSKLCVITDSLEYADVVSLRLAVRHEDWDTFSKQTCELTAGRIIPNAVGSRFDYR